MRFVVGDLSMQVCTFKSLVYFVVRNRSRVHICIKECSLCEVRIGGKHESNRR